MGKSSSYDTVPRGGVIDAERIQPGRWVFFQRGKECGGGWWGGRTYHDYYEFGLPYPTSLREGVAYMFLVDRVESGFNTFDEDFQLK